MKTYTANFICRFEAKNEIEAEKKRTYLYNNLGILENNLDIQVKYIEVEEV